MKCRQIIRVVAIAAMTVSFAASQIGNEVLQPQAGSIPPAFFGMHMHRIAFSTPWPVVPFGSWRLWDAYVQWPNIEPSRGKFDFSVLDKEVELAGERNVEVLLPLGTTPIWASSRPGEKSAYKAGNAAPPGNIDDWQSYVRAVGTRYKGRIHYYEIWNEPNLKEFFSGSPDEMVVLAREANKILKQIDPTITIVSPSATRDYGVSWLDRFLASGGGQYVDVIGYHFYTAPDGPEQVLPIIAHVKSVMQKYGVQKKELWDTETGWYISNHNTEVKPQGTGLASRVLSDDEASAYIARSSLLLWASGVSRLYWYAWDDGLMGLTEADGSTVKAPAFAYKEIEKWLVGARITSCKTDNEKTWTCALTREGGYRAWVLWNPNRTTSHEVPGEWHVIRISSLNGGTTVPTSRSRAVVVTGTPILLENQAR